MEFDSIVYTTASNHYSRVIVAQMRIVDEEVNVNSWILYTVAFKMKREGQRHRIPTEEGKRTLRRGAGYMCF